MKIYDKFHYEGLLSPTITFKLRYSGYIYSRKLNIT